MVFSDIEVTYLRGQSIGRLATVALDGTVQNNPVSFLCDTSLGTIDVGGYDMGLSKKFRNVERGSTRVAFVVDELVSAEREQVRGIEVRGWAEALRGQQPYMEGLSNELIRIHPMVVFSWGIDPEHDGMRKRVVEPAPADTENARA